VNPNASALLDPGAAPPLVNASRFRAAHAADWERLDEILQRIEKGSLNRLSDEDLLALPSLYRTTLSSLSVARDTSLDRALVAYLEQLSTRAYFQIYGVRTSPWRQLGRFFARDWAEAVQGLWRETLVAVLLTIASAAVAWLLVAKDPSWYYGIIPQQVAGGRDPTASIEALRNTLYERHDDFLGTFATFLFTHNSQIAIFAFALGFALCLPTAGLMVFNGCMAGAFLALFASRGLGVQATGWLMIHGVTELFAVTLAGAAGFSIGWAVAFPGERTRVDAAAEVGRRGATVMAGVVVMLFVAGLLEGFARQLIQSDVVRLSIAAVSALFWGLYFYLPRRARPA
jgi:uncharacterized membrane protein SpoIIM required for sporulation